MSNLLPRRHSGLRMAALGLAVFSAALSGPANAQSSYPDRPIRLVVPFVPGGVSDVVARQLAQRITEQTGKPIVIENRAGAGGRIGYEHAAKAAPDGYTVMITDATYTMLPGTYGKLNWEHTDLTGVLLVAQMPFVLAIRSGFEHATLEQFVRAAKANPARFSYGSSGNGAVNHLVTELFTRSAGISLQHVPYKGMGDVVLGLLSSQVDLMVTAMPTAMPHFKSGKMTALAVSSERRSAAAPNVPTAKEQGVDFVTNNWVGLTLPKGSPPAAYQWLQRASLSAIETPELRDRFAGMGAEINIIEGDRFDQMIRSETQRWSEVIRAAGIRAE